MWDDYIQKKIDPNNKYVSSEPRHFERIAESCVSANTYYVRN